MPNYWPRFTRENFENSVAPIDYLEWYIPRLQEARTHNLSYSGMQYNWDIPSLLGEKIAEIGIQYMGGPDDPRIIIAQREGVNPDNVLITHGATQGINIALLTAIAKIRDELDGKVIVAAESPTYAPIPQTALILADEVVRVDRTPPKSGLGHWRINHEQWDAVSYTHLTLPTTSSV